VWTPIGKDVIVAVAVKANTHPVVARPKNSLNRTKAGNLALMTSKMTVAVRVSDTRRNVFSFPQGI
jgi:hypothetical protein